METEIEIEMRGRLTTPAKVKNFMFAGKSTITVRSAQTGVRFTYRTTKMQNDPKRLPIWLVSLMAGPDNENSFAYMGMISANADGTANTKSFRATAKSKVFKTTKSWIAMEFVLKQLDLAMLSPQLEIWHEGRCGHCNRKLTVPESIESGIGPVCATKGF